MGDGGTRWGWVGGCESVKNALILRHPSLSPTSNTHLPSFSFPLSRIGVMSTWTLKVGGLRSDSKRSMMALTLRESLLAPT